MKLPIYLDYMATTPVDPRVVEVMTRYLGPDGDFGNPASTSHLYGWNAEDAITKARQQVADLVNAQANEIIWTSGATESDNLAIIGAVRFYKRRGKHIITSKTEHKAVLDTCAELERKGYEVTYLSPQANGLIELVELEKAIRKDTVLVSIMHVNNEIGVVQDIAAIGEITRHHGVLFHSDAAQSAGKVDIDLQAMKVDLMSFSAHKNYGPKGIGALYVQRNPRVRLLPLIHGGGHERGMRSGTLATHQIVGMGEAFAIAKQEMHSDQQRIKVLRDRLWQAISQLPKVRLNGDLEQRIAGILNVSFAGVAGEALMMALKDLAVSSGSACTSATVEPSYVLTELGLDSITADAAIRFSIGRFTTDEQIEYAIKQTLTNVELLRQMSPLWESVN